MGGLGHYLEEEGLATTQISLVREHTEQIRPPRALWVPFPLGRPLGVPRNPDFQRRVLTAALELLKAEEGPVLVEFPDDAPADSPALEDEMEGLACPVPMSRPLEHEDEDDLAMGLECELAQLDPWYDLSVEIRGRTTVGASGLDIREVARYVLAILDDPKTESPRPGLTRGDALKLACEDLRAYYMEAATAQPGGSTADERDEWFWNETAAGKAFLALKPICAASDDKMMRAMGNYILVPRAQLKGVGDNPEYEG